MGELAAAGINSFKFFLAYKGAFAVTDAQLLKGLARCKELGALPMVSLPGLQNPSACSSLLVVRVATQVSGAVYDMSPVFARLQGVFGLARMSAQGSTAAGRLRASQKWEMVVCACSDFIRVSFPRIQLHQRDKVHACMHAGGRGKGSAMSGKELSTQHRHSP